jgi:hypothetical protein
VDGERVHAAREVIRKNCINHAVAFDPGLTFEGVRHDMNPEMGLAARPGPGMAFMLVRFVHHVEALRHESLGQLLCDEIGGPHAVRIRRRRRAGQWRRRADSPALYRCQDLKVASAKAHSVRS